MKLVSYYKDRQDQLAILVDGLLYDTDLMHPDLPVSMSMFLNYWEDVFPLALGVDRSIKNGNSSRQQGIPYDSVQILAPVPHPTSCRDAYAFRQHVASARRNRKAEMISEFDQYPIFYFTNHNSIQGPGEVVCMPDHFEKLDFELEAGIVICKPAKNIKSFGSR